MSISDQFGTDISKIPKKIMNEIRETIKKIYDENIIYIDITGYNFIFYKKKIWIIDFEHCNTSDKFSIDDDNKLFVEDFINGLNKWNENFL
jgi:tRNA A-37 threonylcarbamoyl transferase component Bud32